MGSHHLAIEIIERVLTNCFERVRVEFDSQLCFRDSDVPIANPEDIDIRIVGRRRENPILNSPEYSLSRCSKLGTCMAPLFSDCLVLVGPKKPIRIPNAAILEVEFR